ncbi:hypothetical protein ACH5RR_002758 [Cinchona calisaya]|uniref:Uncharacterized protein n=1 Tax=Cinchona calisaya TaxID=153742 RepID=A0ABD3ATH3_9GENT
MKMEWKLEVVQGSTNRWFLYLDKFKAGNGVYLSSEEVLEALDPYIMVATIQRYRDNRHASMGAEKKLDIELWDSNKKVLQSFEITWLSDCYNPCRDRHAIVVGNENRYTSIVQPFRFWGISDEALDLSDLHCSIPMKVEDRKKLLFITRLIGSAVDTRETSTRQAKRVRRQEAKSYACKSVYQDVNLRSYFGSIRPPTRLGMVLLGPRVEGARFMRNRALQNIICIWVKRDKGKALDPKCELDIGRLGLRVKDGINVMNEFCKGIGVRVIYAKTLEEPIEVVSPNAKLQFQRVTGIRPLKLTWLDSSGDKKTYGFGVDFNGGPCGNGGESNKAHNLDSTRHEGGIGPIDGKAIGVKKSPIG